MHGSAIMIPSLIHALIEGTCSIFSQEKVPSAVEMVVCPPSVYLQQVGELINSESNVANRIKLGAQNSYCETVGAFTGEVSPGMLRDVGCQYVILGHSERRQLFLESDELIARKFVAAYHTGLIPILCVGETQSEREQGKAFEVVSHQLAAVFASYVFPTWPEFLIAYEPVWAIGTGQTATPEQAETMHGYIRQWVAERDPGAAQRQLILYGGSIRGENAAQLFSEPNIDGGLVGGASLDAQEFLTIYRSAIKRL
jgi:triosephosphate isomerase